ncbi:RteC domain-containing protein [Mucilaginibacter sp. dw_454]|uniref:RteC domain-containing protein n=1 Tax=Mucilaginibacter sp. dw_454 TaxID=2720079 RepID=UPI001BD505E4|nr:RteC domain-containing protein [Mucilaginibacter sp. dw_454]
MKIFTEQRFTALQEEIAIFNDLGTTPVKRLTGVIGAVRLAVNDLKAALAANPITNQGEEIDLFKYGKPQIVAEQIYALEVFTIESSKPIGEEILLKAYYEQELKYIRRFFDQHRFLYQYYLLDGSELDALYFVRNVDVPATLLPDGPDLDPEFSTAGDYLFAKFIAYERLQEFLIGCLYHRGAEEPTIGKPKRKPMNWTGDKSNLVEVAYGIYGTQQINDGKITIAEIIEWLEDSFNISLSRYYRRFSEIKMRKSVSQSKYLDEMREAFLRYIEEGDAWKPGGTKQVKP